MLKAQIFRLLFWYTCAHGAAALPPSETYQTSQKNGPRKQQKRNQLRLRRTSTIRGTPDWLQAPKSETPAALSAGRWTSGLITHTQAYEHKWMIKGAQTHKTQPWTPTASHIHRVCFIRHTWKQPLGTEPCLRLPRTSFEPNQRGEVCERVRGRQDRQFSRY